MEKDKHDYIEAFGLFAEREIGINQTMGRIMGWLLVCEPPQQTLDDICEALDMAKSTISTTVRAMTQFGLVERVSVRGDRRHFYRIRDEFWFDAFERSMGQFNGFRVMAEKGLALLSESDSDTRRRLEHMQDLYTFLQAEMPALLQRWRDQQEAKHPPAAE